jgi:hypothetical protein
LNPFVSLWQRQIFSQGLCLGSIHVARRCKMIGSKCSVWSFHVSCPRLSVRSGRGSRGWNQTQFIFDRQCHV